ncbi:MAG: acyltransferase [Bacteroidales bacterium]|nr:acyltransferase [Bacteroidales bacterium]
MEYKREIWIDWLRVCACFMVMVVHSTEPFYLGGDGALILTRSDAFWAALFDCLVRCCVPLFVVASSYLQFPLHYGAGEFLRRRAVRILVPFAVWSVFYAFWWGEPVENLKGLLLNFNYAAGHLWFVYMLVGLYLIMPLLSPWAQKVGKKELQIYIAIWLFTTLIPLLRGWLSQGATSLVYGPTGIPRQAMYPLWGEASWNSYGTFYYISGMAGYLLLGLYFRRFAGDISCRRTLLIAIPSFLGGFAICFGGFIRRVLSAGSFPASGDLTTAVDWETTWCFDTIGVAMMTVSVILLFRRIKSGGGFYQKIILPLSKAGYGMYLIHMIFLSFYSGWLRDGLGIGAQGILGIWTTPVQILLTAALSFVSTALAAVLLQRIPRLGRYLMG